MNKYVRCNMDSFYRIAICSCARPLCKSPDVSYIMVGLTTPPWSTFLGIAAAFYTDCIRALFIKPTRNIYLLVFRSNLFKPWYKHKLSRYFIFVSDVSFGSVNIPALVQIMASRRPGDKYICGTGGRGVKLCHTAVVEYWYIKSTVNWTYCREITRDFTRRRFQVGLFPLSLWQQLRRLKSCLRHSIIWSVRLRTYS